MTDMMTWTPEQIRHWLRYGVSPAAMGERTEPGADSAKATPAYTVTFRNAISPRGHEEHTRDTFEAAVELANTFDAWPYNNTRVDIVNNETGHVDNICPDRQHRFGHDSSGEVLCVCGFRPVGVGADAEQQVEEHAHQHSITA